MQKDILVVWESSLEAILTLIWFANQQSIIILWENYLFLNFLLPEFYETPL